MSNPEVSRRKVLRGVAVGGTLAVASPLLAACGDDSGDETAEPANSPSTATSESGGTNGSGGSNGGDAGGAALVATAEVPEGGGVVLDAEELVVTQPKKGQFKCFTAVCTHQGCTVGDVSGGTINCPCHGSQFSIADGSVVAGPAPSPLSEVEIAVDGKEIVQA